MNKSVLVLTAAALAAGAVPALAADMPAPYMPVKAAPVAPAFSWTGLYFGLHAGYAWGELTSATMATVDHAPKGGLFGGQIGYNWQQGTVVFGVEADVAYAPIRGGDGGIAGGFGFIGESKMNTFGTVRGRLGFTWDRAMIYATGGYAWAQGSTSLTVFGVGGDSLNVNLDGWTAGGGIEWAIANNWTMRAEYLYVDFHDKSVQLNIAGFPFSEVADKNMNVVRIGVNYKM